MAEEPTGTQAQAGQATGTPSGTTPATPAPTTGQPAQTATPQTTPGATPAGTDSEPAFFDPKELDPSLLPAYKQMQRAFTKKMEDIKQSRTKIEAYDLFSKDPVGQMQRMAAQMGYKLSRAEIQDAQGQTGSSVVPQDWNPQSWGEVFGKMGEMLMPSIRQQVLGELNPYLNRVQELTKTNLEKMLDENAPDWRQYEDEMKGNLQKHPSLVNDPVTLYKISVPSEVQESAAMQKAIKKLEAKTKGSQVGGSSTTTKHPGPSSDDVHSFNDAVRIAKAQLAERGLKLPGS